MQWETLFMPYRLGCPKEDSCHQPDRTEFQRDFDRIIFSTAFRRLNGKTQVIPFPASDIIHTRLTHSLETASVGRSLGTIVGNNLKEKYDCIDPWHLGAIVCAACLAHDIGNPPLGHSGENAISEYYSSDRGRQIIEILTKEQRQDLLNFEGNSMGLHILTYSNPNTTGVTGGLGLTYPVLAAYVKYPRQSLISQEQKGASEKKPGIFQCEIEIYKEIAKELGVIKKNSDEYKWFRHPMAFLTEAADDICYVIMDFEDGFKHGLLSYQETEDLLVAICESKTGNTKIDGLKNIKDERNKIGFLRAKAINSLVYQTIEVFLKNEVEIRSGEFDKPLCKLIEANEIMDKITKISRSKIYSYKPVVQIEAAGYQVLPGLLDSFLYALKDDEKDSSKKIAQLLPREFRFNYRDNPYTAIMGITTYVAGMTDSFAVDTYRNLRGIQLPNH